MRSRQCFVFNLACITLNPKPMTCALYDRKLGAAFMANLPLQPVPVAHGLCIGVLSLSLSLCTLIWSCCEYFRLAAHTLLLASFSTQSKHTSIHPSIHPSLHPSLHSSVYVSICVSAYLSIYPSLRRSVYPSTSLPISVSPTSISMNVCIYIYTCV